MRSFSCLCISTLLSSSWTFLLVLLLLCLMLTTSVVAQEQDTVALLESSSFGGVTMDQAQEMTMVELITTNPSLTTLTAATIAADLVDVLSGNGPYTVMTPWNEAFNDLPDDLVNKLLQQEWIMHLQDIIKYHVHLGEVKLDSLSTGQSRTLPMANGEDATASVTSDGRVRVNNENGKVIAYAEPSNGVAYMLDAVLLPSFLTQSLVDVASSNPATFSTLTSLVVMAGYEDVLNNPNANLTVFAPTNEAFAALDPALVSFLTSPDGLETLQTVLLYHVLPVVAASINIPEGQPNQIASLAPPDGQVLTIERTGDTVTVNDVIVTIPDVLANNGIIHVINEVLIPPVLPTAPVTPTVPLPAPVSPPQPTPVMTPPIAPAPIAPAPTVPLPAPAPVLAPQPTPVMTPTILEPPTVPQPAPVMTPTIPEPPTVPQPAPVMTPTFPGPPTVPQQPTGMIPTIPVPTVPQPTGMAPISPPRPTPVIMPVPAPVVPATGTLVDVVSNTPSLSTLAEAVVAADLQDALSSDGPFTVFAPDNEAFASVATVMDEYLNNVGWILHLQETLLFHVTNGQVLSSDLTDMMKINMLNDEEVTVDIMPPATTTGSPIVALTPAAVTGQSIVETADVMASNGVAHIVSNVLLPSYFSTTIVDLARIATPVLSTLIVAADLESFLAETVGLTVFAPTDAAFEALPAADVAFLTSPEGEAALVQLLSYHVVNGVIPSVNLFNDSTTTVPSVQGSDLIVVKSADGNVVTVNNIATVTTPDVLASNGIIHIIDAVLMLPTTTTTRSLK